MKTSIGSIFWPVSFHHASFLIKTGRMNYATRFFNELGWVETGGTAGDWGYAKFFRPPDQNVSVQLTQYSDHDPRGQSCVDDVHLALAVHRVSAEVAANVILEWARNLTLEKDARIEMASSDGLKWFVFLPEVFTFALEIVQVDF